MIKFLELVKSAFVILTISFIFSVIGVFAVYSTLSQHEVPYNHQIRDNTNPSNYYNVSFKNTIKKSRLSTVQVVSIFPEEEMISTSSGTYFESYGSYFVVSVAHGLGGPCENTKIVVDGSVYSCIKYIEVDQNYDYAIIQTEKIKSRKPIKIPQDLPKNKEWLKSLSLLNKVVYTGYPNNLGALTISGEISGFSSSEHVYIISYAWQGSSGSGVFDHSGKYIGYVVAVDVGQTDLGVQILQNVVLVMPAYKIDWTKAITEAE
tara:strand:+ start:1575 stop:2360 length:786 start_codon:yes stop_codon:yes gene_type:complete